MGEKKSINVPFLVSSGFAGVYLARDTFTALGFEDPLRTAGTVNVHGFDGIFTHVSPAESPFKHLNILGQQFFNCTGVKKYEDIRNDTFLLYHPSHAPVVQVPAVQQKKWISKE